MLQVSDLHVRFGGIEALRGVSLRAEPGEIVAVLGRNGAGKSTLLRTISGLTRPWRGTVTWKDQRLDLLSAGAINRLGVVQVPEGRRILAELSVRDNLLLGGYGRRRGREESVRRVLELFPVLEERLDTSGAALSGGQQQMLAIGRGLVAAPQLLMIDELSLGLAPIVVEELAHRLERLRDEGVGILLVEQEYPLALRIADRVYVIEKGRVSWAGPPSGARDVLVSSYFGRQTAARLGR